MIMMKLLLLMLGLLTVVPGARAAEGSGPVTIGGVPYDAVDPGEPFRERPHPAQDWQAPAPGSKEKAAGMMAYVTLDPGDYRPWRIPRPKERVQELSTFLAQDEAEPVWFGVYALSDLRGLKVSVHTGGAPVKIDIRHMHFWPQRTGWRSREYYITPELLLPCREGKKLVPAQRGVLAERAFDLQAQETAAFWLTLQAAPAARPGAYRGAVTVGSEGRPGLMLPLTIEVLPFRLRRPAYRQWLLYCDASRWSAMSEKQVLSELRDFARHGITGLVEMPLGGEDLSGLPSGPVRFDAAPFRKLAALCVKAGIPGPHVCSYGGVPERVRDRLGLTCDLTKDPWPEALKAGVAAVAKAAVEATRNAPAPWYFYGPDEPGAENTYAVQTYECWHRGGAKTYATSGDLRFFEQAAAGYLTACCFVSYLISSEREARTAREGSERRNAEFWWYGTGCYVNPYPQEGSMFANRYGAGFLFWKTGAKAQVTWTFCRPHEDVFNDFDGSRANAAEPKEQVTAYPHLLRPDDWSTYQGAIPTIAWESLREGVDDCSYLALLSSLIDKAGKSPQPAARKAAQEAQAALTDLVGSIPWANPMLEPAFATPRLQQVRRAVADWIVKLQALLGGRPPRSA